MGVPNIIEDLENLDTNLENSKTDLENLKENFRTFQSNIFNTIYPVGSIYMSTNSVNPASIFGGTWEQIKDRFLLATGDSYTAGSTGGEATHKLTINEIPSHGHQVYVWNNNNQNFDAYTASPDGSTVNLAPVGARNSSMQWQNSAFKTAGSDGLGIGNVNGSGDLSGVTHFVGGSQSHNNMPPYLTVYVWKRTA